VGNEKNEDRNTKDEITQFGNGKNETKEHIELFQDLGNSLRPLVLSLVVGRSTLLFSTNFFRWRVCLSLEMVFVRFNVPPVIALVCLSLELTFVRFI
jgi:hypothetical protein